MGHITHHYQLHLVMINHQGTCCSCSRVNKNFQHNVHVTFVCFSNLQDIHQHCRLSDQTPDTTNQSTTDYIHIVYSINSTNGFHQVPCTNTTLNSFTLYLMIT